MRRQLRILFEHCSGLRIFKHLPLGVDEFADAKRAFPLHDFSCLLDIGANVGQTARRMRHHFPDAEIHSLEPLASTYTELQRNARRLGIKTHKVALGARNEAAEIQLQPGGTSSELNTLVAGSHHPGQAGAGVETVEVRTLQTFAAGADITRIDILKIDTEGFDLEVLKGAGAWIDDQRIPFILTEVSMNPKNTFHVPFEIVKGFMEQRGYYLFGLYDQAHEWKLNKHILRRANTMFVSARLAGL